jgi:hypothetical protein
VPVSTSFASRILMAISSVLAFLALGLPFALESGAAPTGSFEELFGRTQVWSGWSLAGASRNGLTVWRVALLLVVVTATRATMQSEAADAAARPS